MSDNNSFTIPPGQFDNDVFHDQATEQVPVTPRPTDILLEIRSVSARLDGFNRRLGDMERSQRLQTSHPPSPSPDVRPSTTIEPVAAVTAPSSDSGILARDTAPAASSNVNDQRGAYRTRQDAPVPPHMGRTAAALAATTFSLPPRPSPGTAAPDCPTPGERYKSMSKGEKSNVRRALAGLGLSVPILMGLVSDPTEDQDFGSSTEAGDDSNPPAQTSSSSEESPLRPTTASVDTPVLGVGSSPVTSSPTSRIEPAPNIGAAVSNNTPVPVSTRPMTCKTEWIGEFDGDPSQLEDFLTRLRDLIRSETQPDLISAWIKAVLRTLPRTLAGNAAVWHQGLSDLEAADLTSLDAWSAAMRAAFPVNRGQLRRDARARQWNALDETSIAYYFHKVRLLRQAFGKDQPDDSLVTDIKDGLPETLIGLLRLPRVGASLADLRAELGDWEPNWRIQYKTPLRSSRLTDPGTASSVASTSTPARVGPVVAPAATRILQTTMGRSASAPTTPAPSMSSSSRAAPPISTIPRSISKFAAAYDPTRVIQASNGQPRRYRPPGKDTVMDLKAPCSYCGGDHFNFEHDYLKAQVRTLTVDDDDYEEYLWDGTPEEDGEGEDDVDPP
ncbi:hypothetical protein A4X06_0g7534 [Tilletia controversa]|uniref:Uncharacterized protein n=1 Tax=Tilletia controversa TaxID=13291 RepID=A0A8X7SU49_9BASI|nr:hypothetical protein CF336_g6717 [Tilletia laevis]KAE8188059.1 hypothetical protein CF328_g6730 [Tilletia controversa]KAE8241443.1 hypothetical protein A4X06_0g7534 [Tilletia controversa]